MTIIQGIKKYLVKNGMFDDQADAVIDLIKADPANENLKDRWNEDLKNYPEPFFTVILVMVDAHALDWIDEKKPKAWFRRQFE